jgi:nicotinamide-nucleotide amidase
MIGEIIAIGDEITTGQRIDTNSAWIAERLGDLGVVVRYHSTVGDDLAANVRVFREAMDRADVVITTGGLGPTADDLTRQAWAETLGVPLERNDAALAHIQSLFAKRQRPMPPANEVQAFFPQGSSVIANPHGTAPGIHVQQARAGRPPAHAFSLPGVPAEMKEMWSQSVRALVAQLMPEVREIHHKRIKCFGVGESDLEAMLPDLIRRGRDPQVGITVSAATITLRISAAGANQTECFEKMRDTEATIHACLGDLIFGYEDDELQHAVVRLLRERQKKLATLELGTGGLVAHWLNEVPAAGEVYNGGEVLSGIANQYLPISAETLQTIANQIREKFQADYVLAIGPLPESNGSPEAKQVLLFVQTSDCNVHISTPYSGHPNILLPRVAKSGLNFLRKQML